MKTDTRVRIGGASAFLFDTSVSTPQLVERGDVHYLVFDYLAVASLRTDPLGKGMAQQLLDFPIPVPVALAKEEGIWKPG